MMLSLSFSFLIFVFLIPQKFSQTSPIYADAKQFYSGQATCDLSSGNSFRVILPFTISTVAHREPFYAAMLTTNNFIEDKQFFYYFMEMVEVKSTSFDMAHYSMVTQSTPPIYYGFNRPCITGFRYMVTRSQFPDKYISMPLEIASTLWSITAGGTYQILYNIPTLASTYPVSLSTVDTVFVHSLVNFRLVSMRSTLNNSFDLTVSFRVVNATRFGLQLKPKYPIKLDTYDDGSVRVFIYSKLDFQGMYVRLDYQIITFSGLLAGVGSNLTRTYTAVFNPSDTIRIIFGWNGMQFNGYATFGFQFTINPVSIGTSYNITLINRLTTSAIPRLDLMILLPSEFRCPNNQILVDNTLVSCLTTCLSGTFQSTQMVGITGIFICKPCADTCSTCLGSATNCTSCYAYQNRVLQLNSCVPMSGFYESLTSIAPACHYSCLNCSMAATNCSACLATNFRYLSANICLPMLGYFENGSATAVPCHYSCAACSITATNCTSCNSLDFRILTANSCPPISGYFDDGSSTAVQCHYSCLTCSTATMCTSCSSLSFRMLIGNACVPNTGYFDIGASVTLPCHYACQNCEALLTNCTSCNSDSFRTLIENTCIPNPGFYDNGVAIAATCDYTCATCFLNSNNCTSCNPDNLRILTTTNTCEPSPGYFDDGFSAVAVPCYYTCLTCQTISTCTACNSSNFRTLVGNQCLPNPGYFENGSPIAVQCDQTCQECTLTATNCTVCLIGFYVSQGECLNCSSEFGQFCAECSQTGCSSCQSGFILASDNLSCISCSFYHTKCLACNSSVCTQCDTSMKFALSLDNMTCISCTIYDSLCETCTANKCSSCPVGYTVNTTSNKCITCISYHISCTLCNSTNCQACSTGFTLDDSNLSCISCKSFDLACSSCSFTGCSGCQSSFYLSSLSSCISCDNYDPECLQCNQTHCIECSLGYFSDEMYLCASCSAFQSACLTCNITNCQSCASGSTLDFAQISCMSCTIFDPKCSSCDLIGCQSCVDGFFLTSGTCQQCSSFFNQQCTNCTKAGCTTCQTGYVVNPTDQKCVFGIIVCGDGLWITSSQSCDDGNLINGDGCDSNCQVETDYVCQPTDILPSGASSCKYTKNLSIEFISIHKSPSSNSISLFFNLEPPTFNQWNTTQISKLINQIQIIDQKTGIIKNITYTNIMINFIKNDIKNQVEIVIDYGTNNLENSYLTFTIEPNMTSLTAIHQLQIQRGIIVKITSENSPVYFFDYSQETYDFQKLLSAICTGIGFMAFAMLVMGFFVPSGKLIMLEGLAVTQIAFFSVLQLEKVPPTFIGFKSLIFSNGYNDGSLFQEQLSIKNDDTIYQLMGLNSGVISNFNINFVLFVFAPLIIGGIGSFLTRNVSVIKSTNQSPKLLQDQEQKSKSDKTIYSNPSSETVNIKNILFGRILCQNTFFGLMVSGYLVWVSIFHSQSKPQITDYVATGIMVFCQIIFCLIFLRSQFCKVNLSPNLKAKSFSIETDFGQFSSSYKMIAPKTQSTIFKRFYLIFIIERLFNSFSITFLASSILAGTFVLGTYTLLLIGMIFVFKKCQTSYAQSFFKPLDSNYFLRQSLNFATIIVIESMYFGVALIAQSSDPYETFVSNDIIVKGVPLGVVSLTALSITFNIFLWLRELKSQNIIEKAKIVLSDLSVKVSKIPEQVSLNESITKYKKEEEEFTAMLNNLRNSSPTLKPKDSPFLGIQEATEKKSSILDILRQQKGSNNVQEIKGENHAEYQNFIDAQWDEI